MNKSIYGIGLFIASLLLTQLVSADSTSVSPSSTGSWWCSQRLQDIASTLKLDAGQQEKIQAIKDQLKTSTKANGEKLGALRGQINELIQSDKMDQAKLDGLVQQKIDLVSSMIRAETLSMHQIYGVLTAEQRTQYQQIMKAWEDNVAQKYKSCQQ